MPATVDQSDLISDGVFGLIDAIQRFEPDRGLQFPTFAVPRIRGAIIDGLRLMDWVPRSVRSKVKDVAAEIGSTSCRERVGQYVELSVGAVPFKKQKQNN